MIDLSAIDLLCEDVHNIPKQLNGTIGGLDLDDKPLICAEETCYSFENSVWTETAGVNFVVNKAKI